MEGLRLRLIEDHLGARLDLGATSGVVAELEELVVLHPLREGLWALLITALYRAGRQADALAAYQAVREKLVEELGLEPGRDLQRLERQVLEHDPALDAPLPAPSRTRSTAASPAGNLPPLSSSLVGRTVECAEVAELVATNRLVTLVGTAGVGKTRLALEVARSSQPPDGAWLVRLDTARTASAVGDTIATALHANGPTEAALVERLKGAEVLVVLDNCEHVVDEVADLIGPLLRAGSGVRILATSQVPLGVDGEQVLGIGPLAFEDAVNLFEQRSTGTGIEHSEADTTAAIEEVCRSLDGLPLAIELAAARTRSLSLAEISRRLADRFSLLRDPTNRRPERQRTLGATIAWSYDLLFPDDQRGLWAISCFVGGAPLEGVEQVLRALGVPEDAAVDVVSRLVDRSLVTVERSPAGAVRYGLLDSVRTYSVERLRDSGEAADRAPGPCRMGRVEAPLSRTPGSEGQTNPNPSPSPAPSEPTSMPRSTGRATEDPLLGLSIAADLGWVWIVLGDPAGAQRLRAALTAARCCRRP